MRPHTPTRPTLVRIAALAAAALVMALSAASVSRGEPPAITEKRRQARAVLVQIRKLDAKLELAIEAYNSATVELGRVRARVRRNRLQLVVAQGNLRLAERRLGARLRDIYEAGETDGTLEILLGSTSLDELIDRIDTANRVDRQDVQILHEVQRFRRLVIRRGGILRRERNAQWRLVGRRAAQKRRIESWLGNRKRLLSSIRSEIRRLQAEERARQARLAAEARARLVAWKLEQQQRLNETVIGVTAQGPGGGSEEGATVVPPADHPGVVGVALAQIGKPYVCGAAGPDAFDCSGLVAYAYAAVGISLPHSTYAQWSVGVYVPVDQLEPGDLVFFHELGHVGLYIGGGQFVQAPHTGDVVKISSLYEGWYAATYIGARRIL